VAALQTAQNSQTVSQQQITSRQQLDESPPQILPKPGCTTVSTNHRHCIDPIIRGHLFCHAYLGLYELEWRAWSRKRASLGRGNCVGVCGASSQERKGSNPHEAMTEPAILSPTTGSKGADPIARVWTVLSSKLYLPLCSQSQSHATRAQSSSSSSTNLPTHDDNEPDGSNGHGGPRCTNPGAQSWRVAVAAIPGLPHAPVSPACSLLSVSRITLANHPRGNVVLRDKPRQSSLNRGQTRSHNALNSSFGPHNSS